MSRVTTFVHTLCIVLMPVVGILWVIAAPEYLGIPLVTQQVIAIMLGLACAAAMLSRPYGRTAGVIDLLLALAVLGSWLWYAWNFESWMLRMAYRTPDMWIPGVFAVGLLLEATRKSAGLVIALIVWIIVGYGFFGNLIPGPLSAEVYPPTKTILYLYADSSGIPGLVVQVIIDLVLPFIIFGKVMEIAGAMNFFTDLALSVMGRRRGGPAKVAVMASGSFGMLSGSTVANIMSAGVITIPLMKRTGFKPEHAAAIEAVASNGGQIMPPVMGATAFIIAEFLQTPYSNVVKAAVVPAVLYYLVLLLTVDSIAIRRGLAGLSSAEVPSLTKTLRDGWMFVLPLLFLLYLLFWSGRDPGVAALYATVLMFVTYLIRVRGRPDLPKLWSMVKDSGREVVSLLLIGGAAGAIVGIMNSTGFAFQLSLILAHIASIYGLLTMLLLTALVAIVLGMGMPTAAVYLVLVPVVAPSVINLGVSPMGAHLFLFYFGLMSMITPPVAIGSMVAAQVAGANMWLTGYYGMRLGITAYFLPFLWVYNPAIILNGTPLEIAIVLSNCIGAALILKQSMLPPLLRGIPEWLNSLALVAVSLAVGSASLWIGVANPVAFLPGLLGLAAYFVERKWRASPQTPSLQTA